MARRVSVRIEVHVAGAKLAGFRYKPEELLPDVGQVALSRGLRGFENIGKSRTWTNRTREP